jgi:hypothetical protein
MIATKKRANSRSDVKDSTDQTTASPYPRSHGQHGEDLKNTTHLSQDIYDGIHTPSSEVISVAAGWTQDEVSHLVHI